MLPIFQNFLKNQQNFLPSLIQCVYKFFAKFTSIKQNFTEIAIKILKMDNPCKLQIKIIFYSSMYIQNFLFCPQNYHSISN